MTKVSIHKKEGYHIIKLDDGKVNAINLALLDELKQALLETEGDQTKGIIISGKEECFSAGLDIVTMAMTPDFASYGLSFWNRYFEIMQWMINCPKPIACAITGYAPAGATILALLSDYRVMATGPKHVLGMNEFQTNFQIPQALCDVFSYYLGEEKAWQSIQQMEMFHAEKAQELGLVNAYCAPDEVLAKTEKWMQKQIRIFPAVYRETKKYMRRELRQILDFSIEDRAEKQVELTDTPETKAMVAQFIQQLKNNKSKS